MDAADSYEPMLALGAKEHTGIAEVGEGIRVAPLTDPFNNVLGIIENPNFKIENGE